jgi:hypothetical protein
MSARRRSVRRPRLCSCQARSTFVERASSLASGLAGFRNASATIPGGCAPACLWVKLLDRAKAAATQGESSFELIRFPCDLCSDGGRRIDVAEIDWPSTLRGEAAEVYSRWDRELRPGDFRLRAQVVEYLDGIPSNIALSLSWAAPDSSEMKQGH